MVAVLNNRPETVAEIGAAPAVCCSVVLPRLAALRNDFNIEDALEGHLANDVPGRVGTVLARIDAILRSRTKG